MSDEMDSYERYLLSHTPFTYSSYIGTEENKRRKRLAKLFKIQQDTERMQRFKKGGSWK